MPAFITTSTAPLSFGVAVRPSICSFRPTSYVSSRAPVVSTMSARRPSGQVDDSAYDDDDATFGHPSRAVGMQLPDLSDADKAYLDAAVSDKDFMARMTTIAQRKNTERKRRNAAEGRTGPDQYMESLQRAPPDLSQQTFESTGTTSSDDYVDSLRRPPSKLDDKQYNARGTNEGEEYIRQLERSPNNSKQSSKSPQAPKPVDESTRRVQDLQAHLRSHAGVDAADLPPDETPDAAALDAQISGLKEQLRAVAGEDDMDAEDRAAQPEHPADTGALDAQIEAMEAELNKATSDMEGKEEVGEVDRQIDVLEGYLSKLKKEEEEEAQQQGLMKERLGGAVDDLARSVEEGPRYEGLGSRPGELSEEEKKEAFEAIRRQAMMRQQQQIQDEFADPLAKPLPTRRTDRARKEEDEVVDLDLEKGPGLSDAYLAVSDLEAEVKKYLFDAKQLLNDHETRMKALLSRLREL